MLKKRRRRRLIIRSLQLIVLLTMIIWGGHKVYSYFTKMDTAEAETPEIEGEEQNTKVEEEKYEIPNQVLQSEDTIVKKLVELRSKYPQVDKILSNLGGYPEELLKLAAEKNETIEFVANYPEHSTTVSTQNISVKKDYKKGEIPLFIQWDKRWGYYKYGNDLMAINGCGPTSLAMVIVGLTGDTQVNPKVVAEYSSEKGYLVDDIGTSWSLMAEGVSHFGITSEEVPLDPKAIKETLKAGNPIIASMNPGNFTTIGHFIVLTGVTEDGKIIVNDPDSKARSSKEWDVNVFMEETANLWKFEKN